MAQRTLTLDQLTEDPGCLIATYRALVEQLEQYIDGLGVSASLVRIRLSMLESGPEALYRSRVFDLDRHLSELVQRLGMSLPG